MQAMSPVLPSSPNIQEVVLAKDQPEYIPLPVAYVKYSDGTVSMISRYSLTFRERLRILFSGTIWWEQLTFGSPLQPQKMYLREPLTPKPLGAKADENQGETNVIAGASKAGT